MTDLSYPVGQFVFDPETAAENRERHIDEIAAMPAKLRAAVADLTPEQLDTPYRPGGWTVRQVVHHVPESHMNSYIRFKLALTEDEPTIKPYREDRWSEFEESRTGPIDLSLDLLDALHARWVPLLRGLAPSDYAKTFLHPEIGRMNLEKTLALYEWHGRHHTAHVTSLRERMGW